jgi:hypothetical protein
MVTFILSMGYSYVSTIAGSDAYSTFGMMAFRQRAFDADVTILASESFAAGSSDVSSQIKNLQLMKFYSLKGSGLTTLRISLFFF